jgi:hypothetical protein
LRPVHLPFMFLALVSVLSFGQGRRGFQTVPVNCQRSLTLTAQALARVNEMAHSSPMP